MLTTLPRMREPTGYFFSISAQGLTSRCLRPNAIFSFSRSMLRTRTSIFWSILSSSLGWLMRLQDMSVMWSRPSMPPRSTKAPKSAMFLTVPETMSPSLRVSRSRFLACSRSVSMSLRREMTMFLRSRSILRISARTLRPMKSPTSPGRRTSTCEAGRKTATPMSTSRPPLIFLVTMPSTTSPSFCVSTIRCHASMRSARRLESSIRPPSPCRFTSSTSTTSPALMSRPSNSSLGISPSDLRPTSITTSSPAKPITVPLMSLSATSSSTFSLRNPSM